MNPGNALRWIDRDGKEVLQQAWTERIVRDDGESYPSGHYEWRDVPLGPVDDKEYWTEVND